MAPTQLNHATVELFMGEYCLYTKFYIISSGPNNTNQTRSDTLKFG